MVGVGGCVGGCRCGCLRGREGGGAVRGAGHIESDAVGEIAKDIVAVTEQLDLQ